VAGYGVAEKAAIVAERLAPGASAITSRHGPHRYQLYGWRAGVSVGGRCRRRRSNLGISIIATRSLRHGGNGMEGGRG
jgi:transposase-like protein